MNQNSADAKPFPSKVYRYRSLVGDSAEHVRRSIQEGKFYFAQPASFNDPFDCRVVFSFESTKVQMVRAYILNLMRRYRPGLKWKQYRTLVDKHMSDWSKNPKNPEFMKTMSDGHTDLVTKQAGVLCLSEVGDDILMWSHYADSHRGICLELSEPSRHLEEFHYVRYMNERPTLNPITQDVDDMMVRALLTKAEHWMYEKEWRAIRYKKGFGVYTLSTNFVTGVILGAHISESDEEMVRGWVANRSDFNLYRATPSSHRFGLDILPA